MNMDWSGTGSMLSGMGALLNAGFVIWLILVTIRYVRINADILASNQATLQAMQQQLREAQYERAGPVIAMINDQLRIVRHWEAWSEDASSLVPMLDSSEVLLLPSFDASLEQASRISIPVYEDLTYAKQQLMLFVNRLRSVQVEHNDMRVILAKRADGYFNRLNNAREFLVDCREHLEAARQRLAAILGPDAIAPRFLHETDG